MDHTLLSMQIMALLCFISFLVIMFLKRMASKKEVERFQDKLDRMSKEDKLLQVMKIERKIDNLKVNHILHFLLTIFTVFTWGFVWFLVTSSANFEKKKWQDMLDSI